MALVPLEDVTVTSTVPAACNGEVAVMEVEEMTEKPVAATDPKSTALAPLNPEPVMVTVLAPTSGPTTGLTALTVGTSSKANRSAGLVTLVPLGVVMVTSATPAASAGEVAVTWVAEVTVNVEVTSPKSTALAPVNPVPVMVTVVPPPSGPAPGLSELTAGATS